MPSRTARLSKNGCGFATPECRAQRDVAVHPRPAPPPPLPAAPRLSTTALGYLEIRRGVSPEDIDIWSPAFIDRFARFGGAAAQVVRDETDEVPIYVPVNE